MLPADSSLQQTDPILKELARKYGNDGLTDISTACEFMSSVFIAYDKLGEKPTRMDIVNIANQVSEIDNPYGGIRYPKLLNRNYEVGNYEGVINEIMAKNNSPHRAQWIPYEEQINADFSIVRYTTPSPLGHKAAGDNFENITYDPWLNLNTTGYDESSYFKWR